MSWGSGGLFKWRVTGSLILMVFTPIFCLTFWYTCYYHQGSLLELYNDYQSSEFTEFLGRLWPTPFDPFVCKMIFSYMSFELALMKLIPGKLFVANPTSSGHIPVYKANGFQCYILTICMLFYLYIFNIFNPAIIYDNMGKFLSSMNLFADLLCVFLTFKGLYSPSTQDNGTTGNILVDFFWGTELYPNILGWDIKQFTNCRFGMMFWQVGIICYAMKQYENLGYVSSSMLVSVLIQSCYIAKFFLWETGYFCTMDIQHDRAGYYICWGCLVWVPCMYTIHTYFLVEHPIALSIPTFLVLLVAGVVCIYINYDCDRQRQQFRKFNGKIKIWGSHPKFIKAYYTTSKGDKKESLLLVDGWWSLATHFHYLPEIVAAFFFVVPIQNDFLIPYFYPVYLTILLIDRAWRDDIRCSEKYKEYWNDYCQVVPYKIIPGII